MVEFDDLIDPNRVKLYDKKSKVSSSEDLEDFVNFQTRRKTRNKPITMTNMFATPKKRGRPSKGVRKTSKCRKLGEVACGDTGMECLWAVGPKRKFCRTSKNKRK